MKTTRFLSKALLALGALATPVAIAAGDPITLNVPFGQSVVLAWSWGLSSSYSPGSGGTSAGTVNLQDISMTRAADAQSPKFFEATAKGTMLTPVELIEGSTKLTFTNVVLTSMSTGGSQGERGGYTENISMTFDTVRYAVGANSYCYNRVTRTTC